MQSLFMQRVRINLPYMNELNSINWKLCYRKNKKLNLRPIYKRMFTVRVDRVRKQVRLRFERYLLYFVVQSLVLNFFHSRKKVKLKSVVCILLKKFLFVQNEMVISYIYLCENVQSVFPIIRILFEISYD